MHPREISEDQLININEESLTKGWRWPRDTEIGGKNKNKNKKPSH